MENKINIYTEFENLTITEMKALMLEAKSRAERLLYQRMLSLKMGLAQEKVLGEELL